MKLFNIRTSDNDPNGIRLDGDYVDEFALPAEEKSKGLSNALMNTDKGALVRKAFREVTSAYLLFDADASGNIDRDEVLQAVASKSGHWAKAHEHRAMSSFMTDARWTELDSEKTGFITFQDFFLAFQSWAGMDDEQAKLVLELPDDVDELTAEI